MTDGDYKWIRDTILESSFYKEFAYKRVWISGSSTEVHPIEIYEDGIREVEVEIQLDSGKCGNRYPGFRRLLDALRRRYPNMCGRFVKMDGSCPDYYALTVWKEGYGPQPKGKGRNTSEDYDEFGLHVNGVEAMAS